MAELKPDRRRNLSSVDQLRYNPRNPNVKTIEGDLWKALVAADAVSPDNANDPKKVSFARAARTDKGVHALGQVCSMKIQHADEPDIVEKINSHLPEQIRLWGALGVQCRAASSR